ncbi:MAG: carboxypeptidase-like regulatory domain-containing protein [Planctomycetota bacterium]|nr:carboxypeptidase-like regulatory domain-containing protein [Planctomycetota bacterium]
MSAWNSSSGAKKRLDLNLESGVTFRALVRNSETGEPVDGIVLWNWRQPGIEGTSGANGVLEIKGMADGEIEFNVTAAGADRRRSDVAGEFARWWSPQAANEHQRLEEKGGFRRNFDDLTFRLSGDVVEVDVFVEPAVTIAGRVLDPDGKPVAGVTLAPAKTGSGNSLTGDTRFSYETNADGRFEMKLPASGDAEYNLIAHDGKYGQWRTWANGVGEPFRTSPGERIEDVELRLTRPATVRGRVTDSQGRPKRGIDVRAVSGDERDNRYYVPTTKTGDDGRYELRFVAPGEHHVQVEPFWLAGEGGGRGTRDVELAAGDVIEDVDFTAD